MTFSATHVVTYQGPEAAPPAWAVAEAISVAKRSPCQKRKVGVVIYRCIRGGLPGGREIVVETEGIGCNGPPQIGVEGGASQEGRCDGSPACRRDCAKRCVHAEPRAIDTLLPRERDQGFLRMVHVKLSDAGLLTACDGPSCVECSKIILDAGIGGIWLFESRVVEVANVPLVGTVTGREWPARWRYYTAKSFHEETERRLGIYQVPTNT